MHNENLNEIDYSELANNLIENPDKANEILSTLSNTEELEDLYNALFAQIGEYDKPYNTEHNYMILEIQKKISARIEKLKSQDLLKSLKEEHSILESESNDLSAELSKEENTNEIGE